MSYIRIDGLSDNQMKHADALWALQDGAQVDYYLNSLSGKDYTDAVVVLHMIVAHSLDQVPDFGFDIMDFIGKK